MLIFNMILLILRWPYATLASWPLRRAIIFLIATITGTSILAHPHIVFKPFL